MMLLLSAIGVACMELTDSVQMDSHFDPTRATQLVGSLIIIGFLLWLIPDFRRPGTNIIFWFIAIVFAGLSNLATSINWLWGRPHELIVLEGKFVREESSRHSRSPSTYYVVLGGDGREYFFNVGDPAPNLIKRGAPFKAELYRGGLGLIYYNHENENLFSR